MINLIPRHKQQPFARKNPQQDRLLEAKQAILYRDICISSSKHGVSLWVSSFLIQTDTFTKPFNNRGQMTQAKKNTKLTQPARQFDSLVSV